MRTIFRYLFSKVKPIYIIPILFLIGVFSIYVVPTFIGASVVLKNEFPLEKSPNPKASQHFINAMEKKLILNDMHKSMDYDNPLIKPFLEAVDSEYQKGVELLPKDSAEDVYWYVMLYRDIYGIGGIPHKRDMSLSYEKNLNTKEELENHYQFIFNKIKRLAEDDFNFDVHRITQYKFEVIADLVNELSTVSAKMGREGYLKNSYKTYIYSKQNVERYYITFSNKYLPLANKVNLNKFFYVENLLGIQKSILFNMSHVEKLTCQNKQIVVVLDTMEKLQQVYQYKPNYYPMDFRPKSNYGSLLNYTYGCKNLEQKSKELILFFSPTLTNELNITQGETK